FLSVKIPLLKLIDKVLLLLQETTSTGSLASFTSAVAWTWPSLT
ncbi:hypothetical protein AWRI1631_110670, partial [Saccharomyces cerevisiae AWRI1631]